MKVLVYGWYGHLHNNIGDELFREAFIKIFPECEFIFTDHITNLLLSAVSIVFLGGGSFLDQPLSIEKDALINLMTKQIFYIGIGIETNIHPDHQSLLLLAQFITIRSPQKQEQIQQLNSNVLCLPDLVYYLQSLCIKKPKIKNSILFLPNITVVPQWYDQHWKHSSWEHFKLEMSQFIDGLIIDGYKVDVFPMCDNTEERDTWAAIEILNQCRYRSNITLLTPLTHIDILTVSQTLSQYQTIITQRYHGIILAQLLRTPYICLSHHDKLKYNVSQEGRYLSYYNVSKSVLEEEFQKCCEIKLPEELIVNNNIELIRETILRRIK